MPDYNFSIVKETLTEGEKDRVLAIFFATEDGIIDWAKATSDFGAASVDSMKVSYRNTMKKLDKAGAAVTADPDAPVAAPSARTPAGKKRKAAGEDGEKPKAKRGRKAKKADTPVPDETTGEPEKEPVKAEATDETMI